MLALGASAVDLVFSYFYNRDQIHNRNNPNLVSWVLWSFVTVIETTSHGSLTGDWIKTTTLITDALFVGITTLILLFRGVKGNLTSLSSWDKLAIIIGIISLLVWKFSSVLTANVIIQFAYFLAFLTTYIGVWKDPSREPAKIWFVWTAVFFFGGVVVVLLRWNGQWEDLISPVIYVILHAIVGVLALRRPTKSPL